MVDAYENIVPFKAIIFQVARDLLEMDALKFPAYTTVHQFETMLSLSGVD